LLPDGSRLAASDVSAAMLTELQAVCDSGASVVPLRCTAEELPIRTGALDLVTAFNSVHHFDLGRFLAEPPECSGRTGGCSSTRGRRSRRALIIQTIVLDLSGSVWADEPSSVSRPDPSGADQVDAERPARMGSRAAP